MTRSYNLVLCDRAGRRHPMGKVVPYRGATIFHEWVNERHKRRDQDAFGLNAALLDHLDAIGVADIYLYLAPATKHHAGVTYRTTVETLRAVGITTTAGDAGTMINLPMEEWIATGTISSDLPWVPESVTCEIVVPERPDTEGVLAEDLPPESGVVGSYSCYQCGRAVTQDSEPSAERIVGLCRMCFEIALAAVEDEPWPLHPMAPKTAVAAQGARKSRKGPEAPRDDDPMTTHQKTLI